MSGGSGRTGRRQATPTGILAGQPKDPGDAEALLRARSDEIDLGHVRRTLQLLEEALSQSDLLPQLERLVSRTGRPSR